MSYLSSEFAAAWSAFCKMTPEEKLAQAARDQMTLGDMIAESHKQSDGTYLYIDGNDEFKRRVAEELEIMPWLTRS